MNFFLGLDCGGTRTRAFMVDAEGRRGGGGESGQGNPHHAPLEQVQAHFGEAIEAAFAKAEAKRSDCASVFAGVAGVARPAARDEIRRLVAACGLQHAGIGVDHDIRIALAGGLGGRPGVALIVGTGSSCYGRTADARTWQSGGWGALVGDEGSGFFLGREAIAAATRMADGRRPGSALHSQVFAWLGIEDISELTHRIYDRGLSRAEIAAFAPRVIQLAEGGDAAALEILDHGAEQLAQIAAANHRKLPTGPGPEVVITGGLGTAKTIYRTKIESAIQARLPGVLIRQPLMPPVMGAVLLAMMQAGRQVGDGLVRSLSDFGKPSS